MSAETNGAARVPLRRLLAYALIEFPVGGAMNATSLFLGFHYATLGVNLTQIGAIMMLARLLDVRSIPPSGCCPIARATELGPPQGLGRGRRADVRARVLEAVRSACRRLREYFGFWLVLFWLGFSMINIPYYAWGAELSPDYHERTRITTWRTISGTLGSFAFLLIPAVRQQLFGVGGSRAKCSRSSRRSR